MSKAHPRARAVGARAELAIRRLIAMLVFALSITTLDAQIAPATWKGTLRDAAGQAVAAATLSLHAESRTLTAITTAGGAFEFTAVPVGAYSLTLTRPSGTVSAAGSIEFAAGAALAFNLKLTAAGALLIERDVQTGGGEQLSSKQVSAMPLNKRDFSQLLLLATGTQTDSNGAANFTQQFTVNGQRGTATIFSMDGVTTTDPEMGGATFSNFNVDAIQEINSSSGAMTADIGHGAAGYTAITSKPGTNDLHGSLFEFVRNAAFDARNFFDRQSLAQPGRIPPFQRNEFGATSGGIVKIPGLYDGRDRTYFFAQYQGFRQMLSTTQVLPVPTDAERRGLDTTAFAGDTLIVPVNPQVAAMLARYPLPNDPQGPYGARTYAASSKVTTNSDQFSVRLDHKVNDKLQLFARYNLNNVTGPLTNPGQTAIDKSFAVPFFDRQRNLGFSATWMPNARVTSVTTLGYIRTTPNFSAQDRTQPGVTFADGAFEPLNSAAGSIMAAFGNVFQLRQDVTVRRGRHSVQFGGEAWVNRDATLFGIDPAGLYTFGGGAAYASTAIRSLSGARNISVGDALPDSLTGFLTAMPFSYTAAVAPSIFAQGDHIGEAAVQRSSLNLYIRDTWKATQNLEVNYGLRYELNSRIHEAHDMTSGLYFGKDGAHFLLHPDPHYDLDKNGFGPRLGLDWKFDERTVVHAGGAITTLLPNLWQTNMATGGLPFVAQLFETASPGAGVTFSSVPRTFALPNVYSIAGQLQYGDGNSMHVTPNTEMDVLRFERALAAVSSDHQVRAISSAGILRGFRNGYVGSYTAGVERKFGDVTVNASYVGAAGVKLPRIDFPNAYGGADAAFAPYTQFDAQGVVNGGYGPVTVLASGSHSTYHSLQMSVGKTSLKHGLGFQASYTFSKSLDDTSAVLGGFVSTASGTEVQSSPQNPFNLRAEKGPSTFDATHALSFNLVQEMSFARVPLLRAGGPRFTKGWHVLGVGTLATGSPFTVFSGIQQTGLGSNGADRPDQLGTPVFSTSRTVREDYFGLGAANASLFSIPIHVAGGTGPNTGRVGMLGRNTFRGPGFHNLDMSLIKDTPIGPGVNRERVVAQFRFEVFNVFNLVNFALPNNVLSGSGFGLITRTSGPSRQIQFSLKILF